MKPKHVYFRFFFLALLLLFTGLEYSATALEEMRILVFPFKNSGNPDYSWISAGITDTVISDLSRLNNVSVITDGDRRKAIREIELGMTGLVSEATSVKAGKITGANLIFTGSYQVFGKRVRVNGRLIDVASQVIKRSIKVDGTMGGLMELQDRVVLKMMSQAEQVKIANVKRVTFDKRDHQQIKKGFRPSPEAYKYYCMGLEAYEKSHWKAFSSFKRAVKLEPRYFKAVLALGDLSNNRGDPAGALRYFNRAAGLLKISSLKGSADEALLLNSLGMVYWNRGDYQRALGYAEKSLGVFKRLSQDQSYLAAVTAIHLKGSSYRALKQFQPALKSYLEAKGILQSKGFSRSTGYAGIVINLGAFYMNTRDYKMALKYYRESIAVWKSIGMENSQGTAYAECEMGNVYSGLGKHRTGVRYLLQGLKKCERLGLQNTMNYAAYNWYLAYIYHGQLNDSCRGLKYIKRSTKIYKALKHPNAVSADQSVRMMQQRCGR